LPLFVLPPHPQSVVLSTKAAHAFVSSAVDKISFSTHTFASRDFIAASYQNHLRLTPTAETEPQFERNL
jgi:hypothetical protein